MTSGLGLSLALLFLLLNALFSSLPLLSLFIFFLFALTFVAVFFIYNRYNCYNTLRWVPELRIGGRGSGLGWVPCEVWWSYGRSIRPLFQYDEWLGHCEKLQGNIRLI